MPIEEHLEEGELLVASCDDFYATDRRLIRWEEPNGGGKIDSLDYASISSVQVVEQRKFFAIIMGFVILLLGLLDPAGTGGALSLVMVLAGIAAIIYGFMNRKTVIEFRAEGLNQVTQVKWRLPDPQRNRARELVRMVQLRIPQEQPPEELAQ